MRGIELAAGFPEGQATAAPAAGLPHEQAAPTAAAGFPQGQATAAPTAAAGFPQGQATAAPAAGLPHGQAAPTAAAGFPEGQATAAPAAGLPHGQAAPTAAGTGAATAGARACRLRFLPADRTVDEQVGHTVLEAAAALGLGIEAPCGGRKLCGKCRVAFLEGAPPPTAVERDLVATDDLAAGVRLACRARVEADAVVRLLPPPRVDWWKLGTTGTGVQRPDPAVRAIRCHVPPAALRRPAALATLLQSQVGRFELPLGVLRSLGGRWTARAEGCALDVVVVGDAVADVRLAVDSPADLGGGGRGGDGDGGGEVPPDVLPGNARSEAEGATVPAGDAARGQEGPSPGHEAPTRGQEAPGPGLGAPARGQEGPSPGPGEPTGGGRAVPGPQGTVLRDPALPASPAGPSRTGGRAPVCGVALDIGTTTIAGYLLDLRDGRQLAAASAMNDQASFGADLISRLHAVLDDPSNLGRLRDLAVGAAGRVIRRACRDAGCVPEDIYEVTVAANTCMHHLLLGLDASALATSPFAPVVARSLDVPAAEIGLPAHPRANVHLLPNVAGFVGADTIAGVLACGIAHGDGWRLLLDVGTNAEIALARSGRCLTCSAAAGPAFEGGNVSCGTVARAGAVSRVRWEAGRLRAETVGGSPASGLCGSGLLDAVRALIEAGIILPSGRLLPPERWPEAARRSVPWADAGAGAGVVVADGARPVVLTQEDVRQLQLAKAAVRAGCDVLLAAAGVSAGQLAEVLLAGAFGNYLDPGSALALGLVPPVAPGRIRGVGNAAGSGAKLALLDRAARDEADRLGEAAEYVELSLHPGFQDAFMEAMAFGD